VSGEAKQRPPDFIGIGTQRSGTTWWFESLLEHPQIVLPRSGKKELHYFQRFCMREMKQGDIYHYKTRFEAEPGQVTGEWTPRYIHDFWTPPLLKRAVPDAKLLVLFRDPIERFRSGLPHRLSMGRMPMMDRLTYDAIQRGRYGSQMRRLLHFWDAERVLVLQYEKCVKDPIGEYGKTLRFLGVDDSFVPEDMRKPRGVSRESAKEPLWPDFMAGVKAALDPEVELLASLVPDIDLSLWKNFQDLAVTA
jgi:hypothetical protein